MKDLGNFFEQLTNESQTLFNRVKDKATLRRVVYASFLMGMADGDFSKEEKKKLTAYITTKLPHFKVADIVEFVEQAEAILEFDTQAGKFELLEDVGKATGESANLIARTAFLIANQDGDFDEAERKVFEQILTRLGLDPNAYK